MTLTFFFKSMLDFFDSVNLWIAIDFLWVLFTICMQCSFFVVLRLCPNSIKYLCTNYKTTTAHVQETVYVVVFLVRFVWHVLLDLSLTWLYYYFIMTMMTMTGMWNGSEWWWCFWVYVLLFRMSQAGSPVFSLFFS